MKEVEHQCPICYWKARERLAKKDASWPKRTRELMNVQSPCADCGRRTFWRSLGQWIAGRSTERPL